MSDRPRPTAVDVVILYIIGEITSISRFRISSYSVLFVNPYFDISSIDDDVVCFYY